MESLSDRSLANKFCIFSLIPSRRWLKPILSIGFKRAIEEDDIYAVKNDMRSDLNTEAFAELWELELKKEKPSLFRIMYKMYLWKVLPVGLLLAIGETVAKYVSTQSDCVLWCSFLVFRLDLF